MEDKLSIISQGYNYSSSTKWNIEMWFTCRYFYCL